MLTLQSTDHGPNTQLKHRRDRQEAIERLKEYLQAGQPTSNLTLEMVGALMQLLANDQDTSISMTLFGSFVIVRHPANRLPTPARKHA
ncbi:hypothetical protein [Paraburkholderia sp. MM6662-R1]|uniref:hypothetical protein n=1 Tax=Paraburkholderia sp. MM6662-R1 TaxID=2991066 RepID=UPI003D19A7B4